MRSFLLNVQLFRIRISILEVQEENTVYLPEKQSDNKTAFCLIGKKESDTMWCVDESVLTIIPRAQKLFSLEVTAILVCRFTFTSCTIFFHLHA